MIERRKMNRGQGGFTLIELLVVIAILAILGGVAVFAVGNLTESADDSACSVEKSTFITANQAALAEGATPPLVSGYLDSVTPSGVAPNVVLTGKYWSIPDLASPTNGPSGVAPNVDGDCDSTTP